MGRILKIGASALLFVLALVAWWIWPIYGFFSHRGEAPLPPFGWVEIAGDVPATGRARDVRFAVAGAEVLDAMAAHREEINAPALTAAVAVGGEIVWQGAVGFADIAKGRSASSNMVVRVGSTSKAITATALARMVERGEIDLDAPISTYLGELPNPEWATITPRMLASHMAGVPHYGDNEDSDGLIPMLKLNRHYPDVLASTEQFDESPLLFEPGSDFEYSSLGTVLLGAVMSAAADKPYRVIIHDEVLEPAGAEATIVAPMTMRGEGFGVPYLTVGERHRPWRNVDLSHRLPGGGWASTSTDLVRIGSLWLDDDIIAPGTRAAFWEPQKLHSSETNEQDYAIGWRWRVWSYDDVGEVRHANHGGVSRGGQSWLLVYPDFDMVIAYNMNGRTEDFSPFAAFHDEIFIPFARAVRELEETKPVLAREPGERHLRGKHRRPRRASSHPDLRPR